MLRKLPDTATLADYLRLMNLPIGRAIADGLVRIVDDAPDDAN
ncbi:MAG TPA: hypothetical protein VGO07_05960 [Candidatus Saccharimonadales bacterium]|jgi:hypothetical protein|nr:hypothetical protein [Candidatus Saccharimonadales bacterium]